jgi:hypothetical protein
MCGVEQFASSAFRLVQSDIVENIRVSSFFPIVDVTLTRL